MLLLLVAPLLARHEGPTPSSRDAAQHIFTGQLLECTPPLVLPGREPVKFAKVVVDAVLSGNTLATQEITVECGEDCAVEALIGESVCCHTDAAFRLLPGGLEATGLSAAERTRIRDAWPMVLHVLRSNWLTSRYLRSESRGSSREASRGRRALSGVVRLTRDVSVRECRWLDRDLRRGTRFRVYRGPTYGCISPTGLAVTFLGEDDGPFIELPIDALQRDPLASAECNA